jgi:hypothetical protein
MKEQIINNLDNPKQLEKLYRDHKNDFKSSFDVIYPDISGNLSAQIWHERLNYDNKEISWGSGRELLFVIAIALVAGLIAKLPDFFNIDPEYYYPRHLSFIIFPALILFFAWRQGMELKKVLVIFLVLIVSVIYINVLPHNDKSDTLALAFFHLPLFTWSVLGFTYTGENFRNYITRIDFLRYNGDLVVMTALMMIAGGILSGVTIGLFQLIGMSIENFYFRHIAIWGIAAIPVLATYLVHTNPQLVKNVSPVIARVFTPLVLIMLVVYLGAMIYTGKDPYNDREFLIIFNLLLIGVMAIILFSIAETSKKSDNIAGLLLVFLLSLVTIFVNGIALSAIIFRISEWGITPNRIAVLGGNILILIHLMMVTYRLFKSLKSSDELVNVEKSIAFFLPVYSAWTVVVIFLFPLMFEFR